MGEWQKDLNGWRWKISVHRKRQMYSLSKQVVLHVSMDWGIKHQNVHSIGRTSVWRSTKVSAYLTHFCVKCNFAPWNNVKWGKPACIPLQLCKENNFIPVLSWKCDKNQAFNKYQALCKHIKILYTLLPNYRHPTECKNRLSQYHMLTKDEYERNQTGVSSRKIYTSISILLNLQWDN